MVANVAFFDLGELIVFIMAKYRRRTLGILKGINLNKLQVFLTESGTKNQQNRQH
jgi:hypothetical protein